MVTSVEQEYVTTKKAIKDFKYTVDHFDRDAVIASGTSPQIATLMHETLKSQLLSLEEDLDNISNNRDKDWVALFRDRINKLHHRVQLAEAPNQAALDRERNKAAFAESRLKLYRERLNEENEKQAQLKRQLFITRVVAVVAIILVILYEVIL